MDLTQLLDAQGEAAHQAWTKRWGESGLVQDYVNVNYEDSDPASIANPFRWNIMDKAQFLHPPEDGITHLRVVTSAQYVPQSRLLAGLIPSMSMHCAKMRHVSWEGLLTARSLSLLAENGPGLETVDLSAAYPVDAITLDALRSSLGHRVDRVQHMHLDLRWALDDRELEERVALDLVRSLRLFPKLRTLHLYVSVSPLLPHCLPLMLSLFPPQVPRRPWPHAGRVSCTEPGIQSAVRHALQQCAGAYARSQQSVARGEHSPEPGGVQGRR